jgi:chemotaxis protein methyltransferase CheR
VLIYFNKTLQERALALFHESLCHRGFLGLGSKESVQYAPGRRLRSVAGTGKTSTASVRHRTPLTTLDGKVLPGMKHDQ